MDATNAASVGTQSLGELFQAAQKQYMTEADNSTLDGTLNGASQLTIEFQSRQTTLSTDRTFVSRWNYGAGGTVAIGTGQHFGEGNEVSVWFAAPDGSIAAVVETQGAQSKPG